MVEKNDRNLDYIFTEIEPTLNRFLIVGLFIGIVVTSIRLIARVWEIEGLDPLFLFLNVIATGIFGLAVLFRNYLSVLVKVIILGFVCISLAAISYSRSGFLGTGTVLVATFIAISIAILKPRPGAILAVITLMLLPVMTVAIWQNWVDYHPSLIIRMNSPITWLLKTVILSAYALVIGILINHLRFRLTSHIQKLEASNIEKANINEKLLESKQKISKLAYYDSLTGLLNRAGFEEFARERLPNSQRGLIILVDIKGFGLINSLFGNKRGDEMIRLIARILQYNRTDQQVIARFSADEFAIWAEDLTEDEFKKTFQSFSVFARRSLSVQRLGHRINFYTAYARYPDDGQTYEECISKASLALRKAKEKQSLQLHRFEEGMNKEIEDSLFMQRLLEKTIENQGFHIAYQPKVDLKTRRIVGMEALARWNPPELGTVSPEIFIAEVTKANLMIPFAKLIFEKIIAEIPLLHQSLTEPIPVSINISPLFFMLPGFADYIIARVEEARISPSNLVLEITEDVFIENIEIIQNIARKLKNYGIYLSLDDFGKGYSSLYYISRIDLKEVKIDRSFIENICSDQRSFGVLECICSLASTFKFTVVAEGVESEEQVKKLQTSSCHTAQGYYFGKPETLSVAE